MKQVFLLQIQDIVDLINVKKMGWTSEREEKLRQLWKKGHSGREIASMLGNTTRNAVIGKAHRLKLERRVESKRTEAKTNTEKYNSLETKTQTLKKHN